LFSCVFVGWCRCNIGNCFEQKEHSMVSSPSGCDLTTNVYNWTVVLPSVIIVKSYMFIIDKIMCLCNWHSREPVSQSIKALFTWRDGRWPTDWSCGDVAIGSRWCRCSTPDTSHLRRCCGCPHFTVKFFQRQMELWDTCGTLMLLVVLCWTFFWRNTRLVPYCFYILHPKKYL
jgi:hypothetical protein